MARSQSKIRLEELIRRATSGRKFDRHQLFRPSLAYHLLKDPFWVWCNYHAPKEAAVDETTRYDELRMQHGIEHEKRWIHANFPEALEITPGFGFDALKNTFRAMLDGAPAIYQPQLWDLGQDTYGKGDLLVRDGSAPSDLGPYHYRVVELKRSAILKTYHVLQAAFYNQSVAQLQGYVPSQLTVVLKDRIETVPYIGRETDLTSTRQLWKSLRDGKLIPETKRPPNATSSPWRFYGNNYSQTANDLVLLGGIPKRERDKLRNAGIARVDHLWPLRQEEIIEIVGEHYGAIAHHVAQAYKITGPILKPGQELKIPRAKRRLYFDFEIHRMRRVARRWPTLAGSLEQIMAICVDLKEAIQGAVYLPVPSFSIKSVAPALGFHWRQKDVGAYQSMVCYWDYLDNTDLFAIDPALIYNEDDCRAMWHVDWEITKRLKLAG